MFPSFRASVDRAGKGSNERCVNARAHAARTDENKPPGRSRAGGVVTPAAMPGLRGLFRGRGDPAQGDAARHPARRWVVERAHGWLHKFRKILVRYERYACNYLGLLQFVCALIVARKLLDEL